MDASDIDRLYRLGVDASIFRTAETSNGTLLYSPYTAFENPATVREIMMNHGPEVLAQAFDKVAAYQGLPVDPETDLVLADAVKKGLISAPGVLLPGGSLRTFAALPYMLDASLTRDRKVILDKALAIVACVDASILVGQHQQETLPQCLTLYLVAKH